MDTLSEAIYNEEEYYHSHSCPRKNGSINCLTET